VAISNFPQIMAKTEADFEIFYARLPLEARKSASKTALAAAFYAGCASGVASHAELLKSALQPPAPEEEQT